MSALEEIFKIFAVCMDVGICTKKFENSFYKRQCTTTQSGTLITFVELHTMDRKYLPGLIAHQAQFQQVELLTTLEPSLSPRGFH